MNGPLDLVIRNGLVLDGTGAEGFEADVAIQAGQIVAVGAVEARGREEIDARGKIVTPGFIDPHTHYDGQAMWSRRLDPSSAHGVTTVVVGNCGVGFAPCRARDRDLLIRVMEGVEDIPELVMAEGLPWSWETFPEYLDALEANRRDIDIAAYVPHSALRLFVMGDRAARREAATAEDLQAMRALALEALQAGAIGIATSSIPAHRTRDGDPIPSFAAAERELQVMAEALRHAGRGVFQIVADFEPDAADTAQARVGLFSRLSETAGRPVTFTLNQSNRHPDRWRDVLAEVRAAHAIGGVQIRPQVFPRPLGILLSHELSLNPFRLCPTYERELAHLPRAEKLRRLRDPQVRARLMSEQPAEPKQVLFGGSRVFERIFEVGEAIDYEPQPSLSIAARARVAGMNPLEMVYDLLLEDDGGAILFLALSNYAEGNLDHALSLMRDGATVLGLGDGGAHYGLICDASYPTFMLSHWVRDRRGKRLALSEAVAALTHTPAGLMGLSDRGVLAAGRKADVNVIDLDALTLLKPKAARDLPGGGRRIQQGARGYAVTIVGGRVIARDDAPTGELPGRLVRARRRPMPSS
jgi:N-acyl-D-aspartate/D-glutamate deacylase